MVTKEDVQKCHKYLMGNAISANKAQLITRRLNSNGHDLQHYLVELFLSSEFLDISIKKSMSFHLYYAHHARLQLVSSHLPAAKRIVDLGGANGSIYEMGYPHKFNEIIVVDLPPDDRDPMYKDLDLRPKTTPNGKIKVHFGDMTNLSFIPDSSVDLVWSGESIEHVDEEGGKRMVREAYRILKPGGSFCLDTPNRLITQIHTSGFIHPEHKLEYYPEQLRKILVESGFEIVEARGIREMPKTSSSGVFHYSDYVLGPSISSNVTESYMQYYHCKKPRQDKSKIPRKLRHVLQHARKISQSLKHITTPTRD